MTYISHPTAVVDEGVSIGTDTKIWHFCHIMAGAEIGSHCVIGQNVMIASGVSIGNRVKVQNNVSLYDGVVCEDEVFIGPSAVFTNVVNPRSAISRKNEFRKTLVKRGATIGANATIVCGVEIGEFAFIGAGAVVINSVLPYALVVGNPAKQSGWVSEYGVRLNFDLSPVATCPESQQQYKLVNDRIIRIS